ncbi:MAG: hypothetical protein SynsKO_42880 [Synoicihabitans sp.]
MSSESPSDPSKPITRRTALKIVTASTLVGLSTSPHKSLAAAASDPNFTTDPWAKTHDRVWLGGNYWANPMEDWRVKNGGAECQSIGTNRSIHCLTHQVTDPLLPFTMTVEMTTLEQIGKHGGGGFRIGIRSELNEHRSNCFVGKGIDAGIVNGRLKVGEVSAPFRASSIPATVRLQLRSRVQGRTLNLTLEAFDPRNNRELGRADFWTRPEGALGNVAVVSNYADAVPRNPNVDQKNGARHRFANWRMSGRAFTVSPDHRFGPLLWSMYSLSDSRTDEGFVMKISALTGPMGAKDAPNVELQVERNGTWESLGEAPLDRDAWVATFRFPNWDESTDTPYKLVYRERHSDGTETPDEWTGTIRANPSGRPLRMAALTCQNDYGFPYEPVVNNVINLDPDIAFFSGDQIYEGHGGFGIYREPAAPAILNYLRKYYQFGWAFRDAMRNQPTLVLPDDHDVFQGNIWGEGGRPMDTRDGGASSKGGYIQPARMVHAVHKTHVAHHPDAFDPTPIKQNISAYYGDMVYGGVSFAILADRMFKSGPEKVDTGPGRADHVTDRNFNCKTLDKPGLDLLGARQEKFLATWAKDWRGHTLKAVLSQTVFAGVATHHGGPDKFLKGDLDAGTWPQTPRNRAVDLLRPAMPLHINGDQHLTTLVQYGTTQQRNSNWSFCTPAISAGYPRWWRPDDEGILHQNRPQHGNANTGEFVDSFGNLAFVYAVGNPVVGRDPNRYKKAHEKGSGFGFVTFDTAAKTYHIESFRFEVDALDGNPANQFPGWPVTLHQTENKGENRLS